MKFGSYISRQLFRLLSVKVSENAKWSNQLPRSQCLMIRWPRRYEWDAASDWVDLIRDHLRLDAAFSFSDSIPQPYKGTVIFEADDGNEIIRVAIGYSDYLPIDLDCERNVDLYFKMQFDKNGYDSDKVVAGGYVADGKRLYLALNRLRRIRAKNTFDHDVFGRFSLDYAPDIRTKAHNLLKAQTKFVYGGALNKVSYVQFLNEISKSKVCIDLPGLGPLCFRLVNYLAIGSCVIAYPHESLLHVPLVDRKHIVYCRKDMSDLVDLCSYYIDNDVEREQIAANARQFFDENLHISNLSLYYRWHVVDKLSQTKSDCP